MKAAILRATLRHLCSIAGAALATYGVIGPEEAGPMAEALTLIGTAAVSAAFGQSILEKSRG